MNLYANILIVHDKNIIESLTVAISGEIPIDSLNNVGSCRPWLVTFWCTFVQGAGGDLVQIICEFQALPSKHGLTRSGVGEIMNCVPCKTSVALVVDDDVSMTYPIG